MIFMINVLPNMDDWERLWGTPQSVVSLAPQFPGQNGSTEMWTLVLPGGVPAKAHPAQQFRYFTGPKKLQKSDPFLKEVDPQHLST